MPPSAAARGRPRRPRLKPTVERFEAPDGDVYLLRPNGADLAVRSPAPEQRALLARLDGRSADELAAGLMADGHAVPPAALDATLAQLEAAGVLEDAAEDEPLAPRVRERFDRQLRYFGDASAARGAAVAAQRRLAGASVLLLGVGGLGCWTAYALVSAGVGRIVLVDGDRVELSNLNRQILFGEADLGRPKAAAAAERLRAFSGCSRVEPVARRLSSAAEVAELVAGNDVVVDLADMPVGELQRWVDAACFGAGVAYVAASQLPPRVRIGPLYVPGRTGCFACQEAAWRERHALYDALDRWRRDRPSGAATFGPACGLVGSLVANEVVNHLTGLAEPAALGRALLLDFNTLEREVEEVPRRSGCPRCSG
ncbi:MAG TPA: TOMM precursor leader peptide-binding protein [Solirubrobacteraceae bacterium]|nr:TOMM precursor leader peptide-binding protein [Solirubrobacteraceae bacterium]